MISFNELRVTPDGKYLIVDVSIQNMDYYDTVFLDSLYVDTQDTFTELGPSKNPVYKYTIDEDMSIVYTEDNQEVLDGVTGKRIYISYGASKHVRKFIDIDAIGDNLFFVWVVARGEPSEDTPCGGKESMVLGVVYNKQLIYKKAMGYINTLDNCNPPREFIDFMLRDKAFKLSLKVGNYNQAIQFWKKLKGTKQTKIAPNCGCNGIFG